jgi:ubiquinol-cytochrome c reductase cytochrome b subunit
MRFIKSHPLLEGINTTAVVYPAPTNLPYIYNFGIFSLVCLGIQLITGIVLVMHYGS